MPVLLCLSREGGHQGRMRVTERINGDAGAEIGRKRSPLVEVSHCALAALESEFRPVHKSEAATKSNVSPAIVSCAWRRQRGVRGAGLKNQTAAPHRDGNGKKTHSSEALPFRSNAARSWPSRLAQAISNRGRVTKIMPMLFSAMPPRRNEAASRLSNMSQTRLAETAISCGAEVYADRKDKMIPFCSRLWRLFCGFSASSCENRVLFIATLARDSFCRLRHLVRRFILKRVRLDDTGFSGAAARCGFLFRRLRDVMPRQIRRRT